MKCGTKRTENRPCGFWKQKKTGDKGLQIFSNKHAKNKIFISLK
jgi:hypothetical protein